MSNIIRIRWWFAVLWLVHGSVWATEPLPSWRDSAPKQAILSYVAKVTLPGSPDFVPVPERIAVFDNDGTLWPEAPMPFQLAFALDELKSQVQKKPELKQDPMVQSVLAGDLASLMAEANHDGLLRLLAMTHAGMTTDEFALRVRAWLDTAKHPRYHRSYVQLAYQPMLELLRYLQQHEFKTYIVSGGGADFMRVFSESVYNIPPEQVIGSNSLTRFELRPNDAVLIKTMERMYIDDEEAKPAAIHQFIGRRPIACFGNSDGDQAMLEYVTVGNPHLSFGLIIHHNDATREYAYTTKPPVSGKLVTALEAAATRGWSVVDMQQDWRKIFFD